MCASYRYNVRNYDVLKFDVRKWQIRKFNVRIRASPIIGIVF